MASRSTPPSDRELHAEAAKLLETVSADPAARSAFASAYAGPDDALAALRNFVHPDPSATAELADLRAAAFGRVDTPEAEARALRARQDLQARDAADTARSSAIASAIAVYRAARPDGIGAGTGARAGAGTAASATPRPGTTATGTSADPSTPAALVPTAAGEPESVVVHVEGGLITEAPAETAKPRRALGRARRRSILFAVAAFVAGVVVAVGVTTAVSASQPKPLITPSARDGELPSGARGEQVASGVTGGSTNTAEVGDAGSVDPGFDDTASGTTTGVRGNIIAATTRLAQPAVKGDRMDADSYYDNTIDPRSSRRLWGSSSSDQVFVYQNKANDLCMSLQRSGVTLGTCLTLVEFQKSGLTISSTAEDDPAKRQPVTVTWDGLSTSLVFGTPR